MKIISVAFSISVICFSSAFAQNTGESTGYVGKTLSDSKEFPEEKKSALPKDAPNVIWILLDDVGFGASTAFGGLIQTPVFDSLANNGLRFNNFHTAGICAPSRAALLTGRNHHKVNMGTFADSPFTFNFPGYTGLIPSSAGTVAEILRDYGYNTFAVGKWGITPDAHYTDAGPYDYWPSGKGFENFLGFLFSQTDQYKIPLIENNWQVEPDGRHLSAQITDKAISYMERQKKAAPDKPFFLYYSPAATHAPHQVDEKWSDLYKGKFDRGWDEYRKEVFERQKELGIIPKNTAINPRNELVGDWDHLTEDQKRLAARFMEVYAGYLTYTDYEIGRVIQTLKNIGQLDNTLIFLIIGDNGASKEGRTYGQTGRKYPPVVPNEEYLTENLANIDSIGTRNSFDNFPMGWAQATNTPFKDWKAYGNSEGGTRNPLIVFYPKLIKDKGKIRNQYSHLIDVLPTTLDIIGLEAPAAIKEIEQQPIQGVSFKDAFGRPDAESLHKTQYFYVFGSRSIYHEGWKATAYHFPEAFLTFDRSAIGTSDFEKDVWQLYHIEEDINEQNDLAATYPEKLEELKDIFHKEALKNNVYPLIDWQDILNRFQTRVPSQTKENK